MNYKIYENLLDNDYIKYILDNINQTDFQPGRVGNRVNLNQKRRKDLFIKARKTLENIDNRIYNKVYDDIN